MIMKHWLALILKEAQLLGSKQLSWASFATNSRCAAYILLTQFQLSLLLEEVNVPLLCGADLIGLHQREDCLGGNG